MNGWITVMRAEWDRLAGWLLVLLGAVAVVLGFLGVADSPYVSDQLAYIASGGIGGLVLVAVGVGLLVSADLHDEWRKLDRIEAAIRGDALPDAREVVHSATAGTNGGNPAPDSPERSVEHRPAAPAISMMQLVSVPRAAWPALALDWQADHLRAGMVRAGGVVALGLVAVLAGWWRAAETTDLNGAVVGAAWSVLGLLVGVVAVAGYAIWLRGRLAARKGNVLGDWFLAGLAADRRSRRGDAVAVPASGPEGGSLLVADGGGRYHQAGCPALAGLTARPLESARIPPSLRPCGICRAD